MNPQRVTLITLGVADLAAAKAFYARLGWREHGAQDGVAFYQLHGQALALFGRDDLAADQGRARASLGTGAVTLAQNFVTQHHGIIHVESVPGKTLFTILLPVQEDD